MDGLKYLGEEPYKIKRACLFPPLTHPKNNL